MMVTFCLQALLKNAGIVKSINHAEINGRSGVCVCVCMCTWMHRRGRRSDLPCSKEVLCGAMNIIISLAALHLAAQAGSASCVSTLLSGGADPNQTDNLQQSPLFPACEGGHPDCIQTVSLPIIACIQAEASEYFSPQLTNN